MLHCPRRSARRRPILRPQPGGGGRASYNPSVRFKVVPRLLDHFGIAMYNTVPKAIAELCANAYDADASRVDVTYADKSISIVDNGSGMTATSVEDDYLLLGRDRREDDKEGGETTRSGRPVIGNKGIGKLAGFGIAQKMIVRTWRDGVETTLTLDREALEDATDLESFEIEPETRKVKKNTSGTEVKLDELLEDVTLVDEDKLRAYLARHLPARNGWRIFVNGVECSPEDIPGDRHDFVDTIKGFGKVRGYYIVATDRRSLQPGFAIRVRDRIVAEPSLFGLNQQTHGYFNLVRIVGEAEPGLHRPRRGDAVAPGQVRDQHEPQRVQPRGRSRRGAGGIREEEAGDDRGRPRAPAQQGSQEGGDEKESRPRSEVEGAWAGRLREAGPGRRERHLEAVEERRRRDGRPDR